MTQEKYRRGPRTRSRLWLVKAIARRMTMITMALLDLLVTKRPRRVMLGSDKGRKYNGNPRYLFEQLAGDARWDAYWLTKSPEIRDRVNRRFPGRALDAWSFRALLKGLSSQWLGFSHSRYDLGPFAYLRRPRFIYLNHGVPLKTMGYDKAFRDPATAGAAAGMGAITCCSEFEAELWAKAFGLPIEKMWITGAPRNDQLFRPDEGLRARLGIAAGQRIVLFAPTYRETGLLPNYLPTPDLDVNGLVRLLEAFNAVLLIRPHYYEWAAARAMIDAVGSPHLRSADEVAVPEVNELLPLVDILVTDYSSIYFDFLLLDRPMIFACFDRDAYARDRGFTIDYDSNTPGHKAMNAAEFLAALATLLSGEDPHRQFRKEVRGRFHRYLDPHSAERVAGRIQQPLAQNPSETLTEEGGAAALPDQLPEGAVNEAVLAKGRRPAERNSSLS